MAGSAAGAFDRAGLARIADALIVAVAVVLPWSTSATSILLVVWLLILIPTLDWEDVRSELLTPAGGLPVLLVLLGVLGTAWADVSLAARLGGVDGFAKLLVIPLLMTQFRRSDAGERVFTGFLAACVLLLLASWAVTLWPNLPRGSADAGVAVKSYIVQGVEFTMCAAGLIFLAIEAGRSGHWTKAAALTALALAFLFDIFFIAISRTTLVVVPALAAVYGARRFGGKGLVLAVLAVLVAAAALYAASPHLRYRVNNIFTATERQKELHKATSSEERLIFWTKSVGFIESAPLIGHGTGSIVEMFRRSAAGQSGVRGEVSANPHNQTFAVAIQLGLLGAAVLWAMWLSHFLLFRGASLTAWIGVVVVTQNVIGSLFNSFLFDFTEGWIYVVGFGVAAGMMRRRLQGPVRGP